MPAYLWTVKDRFGNRRALRIEAATTEQARQELEEQGHTELQLQTDDIASGANEEPDTNALVSAEQQVKFLDEGRFTVGNVLLRNLWDLKWLYGVILIGALWNFFTGLPLLGIIWAACIPVIFVWRSAVLLQGLLWEELFAAKEWRQWKRLLEAANRLERFSKLFKLSKPEFLVAGYRAQAKAGLGDPDGAIRDLGKFESNGKTPHWFYLVNLAMVYDAARDFDKALEISQQAVAEGPPSGSLHLSLAERLIFRKRDVVNAKAALAKAEALDMPPLAQPFLPLCRGMIEHESGNNEQARQLLEEALGGLQRLSHHSLIGPPIRLAKAYLCLSCAAGGDIKTAEKFFADVKDYMVAIGELDLLQRCEKSLGRSLN